MVQRNSRSWHMQAKDCMCQSRHTRTWFAFTLHSHIFCVVRNSSNRAALTDCQSQTHLLCAEIKQTIKSGWKESTLSFWLRISVTLNSRELLCLHRKWQKHIGENHFKPINLNPFKKRKKDTFFSCKKLNTSLNRVINILLLTHYFSRKMNLNSRLHSRAKNYTLEWNGLTYNSWKFRFPWGFLLLY